MPSRHHILRQLPQRNHGIFPTYNPSPASGIITSFSIKRTRNSEFLSLLKLSSFMMILSFWRGRGYPLWCEEKVIFERVCQLTITRLKGRLWKYSSTGFSYPSFWFFWKVFGSKRLSSPGQKWRKPHVYLSEQLPLMTIQALALCCMSKIRKRPLTLQLPVNGRKRDRVDMLGWGSRNLNEGFTMYDSNCYFTRVLHLLIFILLLGAFWMKRICHNAANWRNRGICEAYSWRAVQASLPMSWLQSSIWWTCEKTNCCEYS